MRQLNWKTSLLIAGLLWPGCPVFAADAVPELSYKLTRIEPPVAAPDFSLTDMDGATHRLSDYRGKVVLVNFWATWCPPCKAEMPSMERLYAQFQDRDFELLAVNAEVDGLEVLPDFLQKHPHTFPIPVDTEGDVQVKYGVFRFPESFIIGRDGKVVEHIIGARDWSDNQTIQLIDSLTKG